MERREFLAGIAILGGGAGVVQAGRTRHDDLHNVLAQWDRDPNADLKGVVALIDGARVAERYYNGDRQDTLHDMRSAGKSVTSLLVGAALDRGLIGSLADPFEAYWPEARGSAIGDVRLADILTMRSGLAANDESPRSPGNEDRLDATADPVAFLLGVPRAVRPGSVYQYNSLTAYAAGLIVEKAARKRMVAFGRETLFKQLGIERLAWATDAAGHTKGQGNLSLTARDMAKIGQMVLEGGRFGGRRVIGASWIAASLKPRVRISTVDPYADGYGYFWYQKLLPVGDHTVDIRFASGNGGNKIYVVPPRRMVVAITSSAYGRGYGQRRAQAILRAILSARSD